MEEGQTAPAKKSKTYEPACEFNKDYYSILMEIKEKIEFESPKALRNPARFRNKDKYCHYQKDVGHDTNGCNNLKRLLNKLPEKGMLNSYVMKSKFTYKRANNGNGKGKENIDGYATDEGVVAMILGYFASGGLTL